jgi:hypothetical protein
MFLKLTTIDQDVIYINSDSIVCLRTPSRQVGTFVVTSGFDGDRPYSVTVEESADSILAQLDEALAR